ncbi:MAG: HAD family hydrolase [Blastocatellia bacterium]|nr:HAD family hydrolase [Blastocatellia bacterium]
MLIVFDLDETLVITRRLVSHSFYPSAEDFRFHLEETCFRVWVRPGARELIAYCQEHFEVGIWSSAKADYVHALAERLFQVEKLRFVWSRMHCDLAGSDDTHEVIPIKDLRMIPFPISRILMVDDDPTTASRNPANLIQVPMFSENPTGDGLFLVLEEIKRREQWGDVRQPSPLIFENTL